MAADMSLKNQFLLAMPGLAGSYFGATLTFICEHNDEGAMGIIVNRPSHVSLIELMTQLGISKGATPVESLVMEGGPVDVERGFILHSSDERFEASLDLGGTMMLSSAREVLEAIADDDGPKNYLVALGYAGWDAMQLEGEVADNAWLTCPVTGEQAQRIIFDTEADQRVAAAAESLGIDFSLISSQAGHA